MTGRERRIELWADDAPTLRFFRQGGAARQAATPVDTGTLLAQLDDVDESCQRVVIAGGMNPWGHQGLQAVASLCRQRRCGAVTLECAASALAGVDAQTALSRLDVDTVAAIVGGIREKVHDTVMAAPGTWRDALDGLAQTAHAARTRRLGTAAAAPRPMSLYVVLPLIRWNVGDGVPLIGWLAALPDPVAGCLVALPPLSSVPAAARKLLLEPEPTAQAVAAMFAASRGRNFEYGFTERSGVSPCTSRALDGFGTVFHQRIRHQQRVDAAEFARIDACDECAVNNSCPGIELSHIEQWGEDGLAPVSLDVATAWRLSRINRLEQQDYKNVSAFDNDYAGNGRSLLRINGHCQMACSFCFIDRTAPDFATDPLLATIDELAERQTDHLVLSGGEPSLHPDLAMLIARARERGFTTVELQTNGVRCEDLDYAKSLVSAGLNMATVSLHSSDAERSDVITKMPGAFPRTLQGLRNLRGLGVRTQIAHVITKANFRELPDTVAFLVDQLDAQQGGVSVCFAIAQGISDLVYSWTIPRFSEIAPHMRKALDLCMETGIGFGGMIGQGGYPPCMLDGELKYYRGNLRNIYRSADHNDQFYKAPRCADCSFNANCLGVRRDYIRCYGDEEIRPFTCDVTQQQEASAAGLRSLQDL